jgi:hypothetical protein
VVKVVGGSAPVNPTTGVASLVASDDAENDDDADNVLNLLADDVTGLWG